MFNQKLGDAKGMSRRCRDAAMEMCGNSTAPAPSRPVSAKHCPRAVGRFDGRVPIQFNYAKSLPSHNLHK